MFTRVKNLKLRNSIWTFILIFIGIYVVLMFLGDFNSIKNNIEKFNWEYLCFAIGFFLLAILIRILRWNIWFVKIEPKVLFKARTLFYLSGYAFLMTPARMGEAVRSYFIKKEYGINQSKTVPLVLVERFYDLIGLLIIIGITLYFVNFYKIILLIPLAIVVATFILCKNKNLLIKILSKVSTIKFLSKFVPRINESAETIYQMLHFKTFIVSGLLSVLAVSLDLIGAFMIIRGSEIDLDLVRSAFSISVSVITGALTFIPGGLGVQEGGLIGFLTIYGVEYSKALVFLIFYRISYSVTLISIGMFALHNVLKRIKEN